MTIDPDVRGISAHFGIDNRLIQAVVNAEGGGQAIVRAVQCSIPSVQTRDEALKILCRSAVHAMSEYVRAHEPEAFVTTWAQRWAPQGAANDPKDLNRNWPDNVLKGWLAQRVQRPTSDPKQTT